MVSSNACKWFTTSLILCLTLLLGGCGGQTKDKTAVSHVRKIAVTSFTAKSASYGNTKAHEVLVQKAFSEFRRVLGEQTDIELILAEKVVADPVYKTLQNLTLPDDVVSPVDGLTYIRRGVPETASETLCQSLGADALMTVHLEYDFKPAQNGSDYEINIRCYAVLGVPPDGRIVWGDMDSPYLLSRDLMLMLYNKTLALKLGAQWVLFAGPDEEQWKQLIQIANETTPVVGEAGSQLAKSFLDDVKAARSPR